MNASSSCLKTDLAEDVRQRSARRNAIIGIFASPRRFNGVDDDLLKHALDFFVVIMLFYVLYQLVMRDRFVKRFDISTGQVFWLVTGHGKRSRCR